MWSTSSDPFASWSRWSQRCCRSLASALQPGSWATAGHGNGAREPFWRGKDKSPGKALASLELLIQHTIHRAMSTPWDTQKDRTVSGTAPCCSYWAGKWDQRGFTHQEVCAEQLPLENLIFPLNQNPIQFDILINIHSIYGIQKQDYTFESTHSIWRCCIWKNQNQINIWRESF